MKEPELLEAAGDGSAGAASAGPECLFEVAFGLRLVVAMMLVSACASLVAAATADGVEMVELAVAASYAPVTLDVGYGPSGVGALRDEVANIVDGKFDLDSDLFGLYDDRRHDELCFESYADPASYAR